MRYMAQSFCNKNNYCDSKNVRLNNMYQVSVYAPKELIGTIKPSKIFFSSSVIEKTPHPRDILFAT